MSSLRMSFTVWVTWDQRWSAVLLSEAEALADADSLAEALADALADAVAEALLELLAELDALADALEEADALDEEAAEGDEEDEPEAEESARGRTFGAQALSATVAVAPVINSAVRRVTGAEEGPVIVAFRSL